MSSSMLGSSASGSMAAVGQPSRGSSFSLPYCPQQHRQLQQQQQKLLSPSSAAGVQRHLKPSILSQGTRRALPPYFALSTSGYTPIGGDARIKVIGVGGGGGNALNRMINSGLQVRGEVQLHSRGWVGQSCGSQGLGGTVLWLPGDAWGLGVWLSSGASMRHHLTGMPHTPATMSPCTTSQHNTLHRTTPQL